MTVRILAKKETALKKTIVRGIFVLGCLITFWTTTPKVWAAADLLLMPAPKLPNELAVRAVFLDLAAAGDRYVAVGEYGLVLYSDDGGTTWQQSDVPTSVTLTAVHFPTAQKGWTVGHDGVVLNSTDAGQTWQIQLSGLEVNKKALAQIEQKVNQMSAALDTVPEENRSEFESRLEDMELLMSDMSVPVEDKAPTPLMDVLFLDENKGFAVGAFGMIITTDDGGKNWDPIVDRMTNVDGYHYYGIEQVRADGGNLLFIAGEVGLLMRSDDGGTTWERLPEFFEGTFFGITADTDQKTILAFGLGGEAYLSKDLGDTWQSLDKTDNTGQAISGAAALSHGGFIMTANNGMIYHLPKESVRKSPLSARVPGSIAVAQAKNNKAVVVGVRGIKQINMLDKKGE